MVDFAGSARSGEFAGEAAVLTAGIMYDDADNPRFGQSLVFVERCRDLNVPVVLVDSSSDTWAGDAHAERGATVLRADIGGIATQRKQGVAFAVANGAEKVIGTESEKVDLPFHVSEVSGALDHADVVIVGRTQESEDSLPPTQQRTERLAGWMLEETHYLPHDTLAGPRGFTVAGAEVLVDYPATERGMNNWIYLYETPIEARRRGLRVAGVDVDIRYPEILVDQEAGNEVFDQKRFDQFALQLNHLLPQIRGNMHASRRARQISEFALVGMPLVASGSNEDRADAIGVMEEHFQDFYGYQPAPRLAVQ